MNPPPPNASNPKYYQSTSPTGQAVPFGTRVRNMLLCKQRSSLIPPSFLYLPESCWTAAGPRNQPYSRFKGAWLRRYHS